MTFILFIAVVVLLFWIASVSNRVSSLENKLKGGIAKVPGEMPQAAPKSMPHSGLFQNQPASLEHLVEMPKPPVKVASEVPEPVKTAAQETETAVNWLNRIGVVALVLGLGFFLKIAIDLGWIGPWMQIIIGLAIGGLLVYLGELWKARFGEKAQALTGGGVAVLYFSIYAAFNFYHLVPNVLAFLAMVAVAAFAVWLSYRNSSLALGALAFFGAYGAPLLYSSGKDPQAMLFGYLTLINIAVVAVMFKKYYNQLLLLTLFGTIIDSVIWAGMFSNYQNTLTSVFFVIVTTILYVAGSGMLIRLHNSRKTLPTDFENYMGAQSLVMGGFYFLSIYGLLFNKYHEILPAIALLGGVVFFFAYVLVDRLNFRNLNYCLSFMGALLLVFAAILQYDGKALAAVFLVLGLLGSGIGTLVKREELRVWGIVVLFMSLFKSLFEPYGPNDTAFLFNAKFGLMFTNTLAMLFVGWMYSKLEAVEFEKNAEKGLQIVAALVLWGSVSWDIMFPSHSIASADKFMTLWWVIYPVALAAAAAFSRRSELFKLSVILLAASFFKVLFMPYSGSYTFLYNIKFGLMLLQTFAFLVFAWISDKSGHTKDFSDALKVAASLLLWFGVSWEIVKYFENDVSKNSRNLYLSLWWIAYSAILMGAGIMWRNSLFRKIAIGLFFVTIVKVFLFDLLSLDLGYLIVSFISLGVILVTVSFVYRKHKEQIVNFLEGECK